MTRKDGKKQARSTVEINGRVYPRTKRRLREWRRLVLLPEVEANTRRRAKERAEAKSAALLAEERRRSAARPVKVSSPAFSTTFYPGASSYPSWLSPGRRSTMGW